MTTEMKGYILDRNKEYPVHKGDFLIEILSDTYNFTTEVFDKIPCVQVRLELYPEKIENGDDLLNPIIRFIIPQESLLPSSFKQFNQVVFTECEGGSMCSPSHYHFDSWYANYAPPVDNNNLSISYNEEKEEYNFSWKGDYIPYLSSLNDEEKQSGLYAGLTPIEAQVSIQNIRIWIHVTKVEDTMSQIAKAMPYIDTSTLMIESSEVSKIQYYGTDTKDEPGYNVYLVAK